MRRTHYARHCTTNTSNRSNNHNGIELPASEARLTSCKIVVFWPYGIGLSRQVGRVSGRLENEGVRSLVTGCRGCTDKPIETLRYSLPHRAGRDASFGGNGGERGIRTLDTVARIHAFQACAFSHSATSPSRRRGACRTLEDDPRRCLEPSLCRSSCPLTGGVPARSPCVHRHGLGGSAGRALPSADDGCAGGRRRLMHRPRRGGGIYKLAARLQDEFVSPGAPAAHPRDRASPIGRAQSLSRSLMEVLARVCSSTRFTITAHDRAGPGAPLAMGLAGRVPGTTTE